MNQPAMKRKIAAILAADVAGYSRLVAEDEEETLRRLGGYRQVFDDFVRRSGGRIFNTAGDSVMCEFDSAVEAVRCAIDVQESLRTRNLSLPQSRRLEFRMGITIGDVVERDGDLLGDGVNIAARLESLAEAGGICVSRSVHEAVANKISVPFRDIGERKVKNIPNRVHAFMVDWPRLDPAELAGASELLDPKPERRRGFPLLIGSSLVALIAIAVAAVVVLRPSGSPPPTASPQASAPAVPSPQASAPALPSPPAPPAADTAQAPAEPAEAFAALARQGGVVPDPKTAPELYHNARSFEARGDTAAARKAYAALAGLGLELVDPHLRYAALLRVQDGRAGAREVYSELMRSHPARVVALVHALQFEGAERRAKVEAFASQNPDFAPAHYLLAEEYSEDRLGTQTLTDRRLEFDALERFLEAEKDGRLAPFFLDPSVLAQWLDKARRRKSATEAFFQGAETKPTASFTRSNTGWTASIAVPEPATAIAVRVGETGPFKSTGVSPSLDPRTGKPAPQPSFELPARQERVTLYVTYDDATGRTAGPFPIVFDPQTALVSGQREVLERFPGSWVAFRPDYPELLYFTHLVGNRCAIGRAEIGLDDGPLEYELPLPPCDEADPHAIPPDAKPYVSVPKATRSVSVQLTYADGTQSEVKTFRR
jgi:class 3 adenylate cyclase